ncbi:MAG: hypothetical protein OES25_04550 [Acidobacteriota bacterium]|nr:hypothetical protein [Acidobacteriota bacterium]
MGLRQALMFGLGIVLAASPAMATGSIPVDTVKAVQAGLIEQHGDAESGRIRMGVEQVANLWWDEDGDAEKFSRFCHENFVPRGEALESGFDRLEAVLEQVDGHLHEVSRLIRSPFDLDTGEIHPVDRLLGDFDATAHVDGDLFQTGVAFFALLNFPLSDLDARLTSGSQWTRRQWAESRMMDRFAQRIPPAVSQEISRAFNDAGQYIANYNIRMDRLVTPAGQRLFPEGLRLITHWGLRDELKSQYAEGADGLERQRMIYRVMQRIVHQEIPQSVIDNDAQLWDPDQNRVFAVEAPDEAVTGPREQDQRYEALLGVFRAVRQADPYCPTAPTFVDRRFQWDRQIPEKEVEQLLQSVLTSDAFRAMGDRIRRRLGRDLEPFDIWYDGFKARGTITESQLNDAVRARYPDVASVQNGLPGILTGLGFSEERAAFLSSKIAVDPSRGAGHAMGAVRREDRAHLRTRIGADGMDYKGYNIAVHELGHNVEQVFSLNSMDHWWLNGVPNTAFTEALAFTFQERDLELLGLDPGESDAHHMQALDTLWGTAEIGGVALVDMAVWRFLYENPEATPAQLRVATLEIARKTWNRYFAPVFGVQDSEILAVYSHMISSGLYLPDYPLGHLIAFQVARKLHDGDFGKEFERVTRLGRLTPDAWMRAAVGGPVSAEALLEASREALASLEDR